MSQSNETMHETAARDLVITRRINAPRELVWKAWTDPTHMKRWWGPKNFTSPVFKMDFRVGGRYLGCMRSPEGQDYWSAGKYLEIIPLEKIVCTDNFADPEGHIVPASFYGMEGDWPGEDVMTVTVTFAEEGEQTILTLRHSSMPAATQGMAEIGWNESLDKLDDLLKSYE